MIDERQQTTLLARTFFARIFESELIPQGLPQVQLVISVVAFFAAPSLILPLLLMKKYVWLRGSALSIAMAQDRTMALLLSMTATAFIALVIWENLFPDRRDSRALGVLPIRPRSFVMARLTAIVALFAVVFLSTAALQATSFGVLGAMTGRPEGFFGAFLGHFLVVAGAQGFVFFGIVSVQCALLSVAGPSAAHRLAVVLQIALIVAVLQMPLALPGGATYVVDDAGQPGWANSLSAVLLPPLWFLSLYQSLVGTAAYEGTAHLTRTAVLLGTLTPVCALAFYAASFRRLTRLAIEGRPVPRTRRTPWPGQLIGWLSRVLSGTQQARAVCAFTLRTIARSRQHRMLMAVWIGVAVALTVSAALPGIVRMGWLVFERPRGSTLVGPLIFAALIQTGMRTLFAIPVEVRSNWAFRLREPLRLAEAISGAASAMIIAGVLPPVAIAFVSATWLWGPGVGLQHAAFCGVLALGLSQLLMHGTDKVPFTCTYYPGTAQIGKFWPAYLTVFTTFTYGMANLEAAAMPHPRAFTNIVAFFAVSGVLLWWWRVRAARQLPNLRFEGEPVDGLTLVSLQG